MSLAYENHERPRNCPVTDNLAEKGFAQSKTSHDSDLKRQLMQAQKMEAIGQLAGGVAHDFNNLLVVMMGYLGLALDGLDTEEKRYRDLMQVRKAADKAANLTRQLLAFSRRQTLQPRDSDLNDLIEELLKMVRRIIGEDIGVDFLPEDGLPVVHVDPGQFQQVVMNLCVNARDSMPDGGELTIETKNVLLEATSPGGGRPSAKPGRYVLTSVKDTGCGIRKEFLEQVFEPFFTTKEDGKGTGLGLSTVYGIVGQHDGFIDVQSEVGEGTTFEVYLPAAKRGGKGPKEFADRRARGGNETLLIAEDDETVRKVAVRVLEEAGYTVLVASNGSEAVRVFREHGEAIGLTLLDVIMPEMKGHEVYDQIVKIDPTARILFSSGYSPNGIHTRFILDDGMELVQKPYDPNTLLRRIRSALDRAR